MRRMLVASCLVAAGLTAVTGCGNARPEAAPTATAAAATPSPSPTPAATTAATDPRRNAIDLVIDRARLGNTEVGSEPVVTEDMTFHKPFCDPVTATTVDLVRGHRWIWVGQTVPIAVYEVAGYLTLSGSAVINQYRAAMKACTASYLYQGIDFTVVGEIAVKKPAGIDAVLGVCEKSKLRRTGETGYWCTVMLARGHYTVALEVFGFSLSKAKARVPAAVATALPTLLRVIPAD